MPKITELPAAGTLTGSEVMPVVQVGLAKSMTTAQLITFLAAAVAGLLENQATFDTEIDGAVWFLNGGSPVTQVTKIFMNGILQDKSEFTINLAIGQVLGPSFVTTGLSNRIDIFWI